MFRANIWKSAGATLAITLFSGAATAQDSDPALSSDRAAYEAAMKCFVVAGNAYAERQKAGDQTKAAAYETKAHAAFDFAVKFGRSVGRNGSQIKADISETQDRELPKLVADVGYNRQSAATCRALGLL